jgi:hypothetical protein
VGEDASGKVPLNLNHHIKAHKKGGELWVRRQYLLVSESNSHGKKKNKLLQERSTGSGDTNC